MASLMVQPCKRLVCQENFETCQVIRSLKNDSTGRGQYRTQSLPSTGLQTWGIPPNTSRTPPDHKHLEVGNPLIGLEEHCGHVQTEGDRVVCGKSRGILLLAKIMLNRLVEHISETSRKVLSQKHNVVSRSLDPLQTCTFIDLSKAFNIINYGHELLKQLSRLGVPPKFLSILQQLHDGM